MKTHFFDDEEVDTVVYKYKQYGFNEFCVCIEGINEKDIIEVSYKRFSVKIAPVEIGPDMWVCDYCYHNNGTEVGCGGCSSGASLFDDYYHSPEAAKIADINYTLKEPEFYLKTHPNQKATYSKFAEPLIKLKDKLIDQLAHRAKTEHTTIENKWSLDAVENPLKKFGYNERRNKLPEYIVRLNDTPQGETPAVTPEATMLANENKISIQTEILVASPKKASTARKQIDTKNYPGAKGGSGVIQKIINQVPKGTVTIIDGCIGSGTFLKNILPAQQNIGIDIDENVINYLNANRGKEKLQHAELVQYDIIKYLKSLKGKRLDNERTFIYLDPPYPKSARRGQRDLYNFEMSDMDHVSLLSAITELKCRIAISTYENDLYKEHLKKWRLVKFNTTHRQGVATEFLYLNYPEPKQLHDTRYVGNNFRERERIKRKAQRWVSNLEEMPPLERQYIVDLMKQKNLV